MPNALWLNEIYYTIFGACPRPHTHTHSQAHAPALPLHTSNCEKDFIGVTRCDVERCLLSLCVQCTAHACNVTARTFTQYIYIQPHVAAQISWIDHWQFHWRRISKIFQIFAQVESTRNYRYTSIDRCWWFRAFKKLLRHTHTHPHKLIYPWPHSALLATRDVDAVYTVHHWIVEIHIYGDDRLANNSRTPPLWPPLKRVDRTLEFRCVSRIPLCVFILWISINYALSPFRVDTSRDQSTRHALINAVRGVRECHTLDRHTTLSMPPIYAGGR